MSTFNPANHPIADTITAAPYRGAEPVEMTKIDVSLYGDGKSKRNSADVTYCACPEKCSLYAMGKCMQFRKLLGADDMCHFGHVSTIPGFTRRAASYSKFREHVKSDPCYAKMDGDASFSIVKIDGTFALKMPALDIVRDEQTGEWRLKMDGFGGAVTWIPENEFKVELIEKIVNARPRNIFGDLIRSYKTESVPKFLENMKKVAPELYAEFVKRNPEYAEVSRDNVGRRAYVATLAEGAVLRLGKNTWEKKGKQLIGKDIKIDNGFLPLGRAAEVILDIDKDAKIEVKDNAWCDENTVFTNM